MRFPKLSFKLLLLSSIFLFLSCGDSSSEGTSEEVIIPEEETINATKQENTTAIPKKTMADLESYDSESGSYVFDKGAKSVEDLKPGTVVLFEGHSLRKIKSVNKEDGKIKVETEFAKLTDYYKEAEISYSAPINWSEASTASTRVSYGQPIATLRPNALINDPNVELKTKLNGWDINLKLTPKAGEKLEIELGAKKGNLCSIKAEGFISSFTSNANISISNGETTHFSYNNQGMRGEMEVKFAAVGLGSEIAILEIPATIEKTILVQGIIPVTFRLKANLKIYPEVAVGNSSQVSMKVNYNSNTGFSYSAGSLTTTGGVSDDNAEQTGDSNTAAPAIAGMGVGVEFPRFEIGILGNFVVPYMVLETHTSSYLSTGLAGGAPPCHMAKIRYKMHTGVTMNFLNVATIHNDYKIFEKEKKWEAPGSYCD